MENTMIPSAPEAGPSDANDLELMDFNIPAYSVRSKELDVNISLNRDKWLDAVFLQANRGKITNNDIFRFCMATLQAGNADLTTFPITVELIRQRRITFNSKVAKDIQVVLQEFFHRR